MGNERCACHQTEQSQGLSRRELLKVSGLGFGSLALGYLLNDQPLKAASTENAMFGDLKPRQGHFAPQAKAIIQLMQNGGPSQMDLFDPKPELTKRSGQPHPLEVEVFSPNKNKNILLASPFEFKRAGQSGMEFSEIIPHLSSVADDLCLVRSMYTEHNNHPEGLIMMQTCKIFAGRPGMGSWVSYALGTENQNLPAYIVLRDPRGYNGNGKMLWSSGFLPALFQGVEFNSSGAPVHHLSPERPLPPGIQRQNLDLLAKLNAEHQTKHSGESELEARIQNFELAARMQLSASEVLDLSKETDATKKLYGIDNPVTAGYGTRCLMARRLIEAGVRFVQVFPPIDVQSNPWDQHDHLKEDLSKIASQTDQPAAGLLKDMKSRGLLDSTIVMWTGEFGRLPITEGGSGRDHNRHAFSLFMAGAGFKTGLIYGATDEFGYKAVTNRVSVPDLHATIYYLLGLDHDRLTYLHHGIPETPTDAKVNGAKIVSNLLKSPPKA
jgi:Protein of unknown function (DUF1501)